MSGQFRYREIMGLFVYKFTCKLVCLRLLDFQNIKVEEYKAIDIQLKRKKKKKKEHQQKQIRGPF